MAGPWEQYQQQPAASAGVQPKPWERYAGAAPAEANAPPLEIDIVGGTRESDLQHHAPDANSSAFARLVSGAPAPAEPPIAEGNPVTRFLGDIGGRQVLQGAGSLYGALGGDALNHYVLDPIDQAAGWGTQLGTGGRSYRDAASLVADDLGMRQPATAQERVYSDIAEALTGTGLTLGVGGLLNAGRSLATSVIPTAAQRLGGMLTAQPMLQTISTATGAGAGSATREGGGGAGAQILAALAGGLVPSVAAAGVPAALRGGLRGGEGNRAALESAINDFSALGSSPSVGQGTGAWSRQGLENLLAAGPTSAGVMARFGEQQADQLGTGLRAVADRIFRNPSAERAGRAIEQGIRGDTGFLQTSRERAGQLYSRLDDLIPKDSRVDVENVRQALASLNSEIPGAPSVSRFFQNARLQGIEGALQQDTGGIEGVLSRPGMRETVDQMRTDLTAQAATRRAELAQETNAQRQDLLAEAGRRRDELAAEAQRTREKLASTIESRRAELYRQADEQRNTLFAEQQAALRENERLRSLGLNNLKPVLSDAEIDARVPTYAKIDESLPRPAEIDAQIPTAADIEAQIPQAPEINQRVSPDAAFQDPTFGQDYVEKQINEFLSGQVDNKLPYEALQKLRTLVGGELEGSSLLSDVPRSKWKAVYGALSKDMEAAASTPEAKQALSRANAYFNARANRIDAIDRVIDRNGGPEKIYSAVMGGVSDGGSTLRAVMQSLPEDGQKAITAAALRRMGMANPGAQDAAGEAFSAATFLTNWNKVSPEARRTLFDRYGPGFSADMDRIARVSERIKDGTKALTNPPGTVRQGVAFGYWGGLGTALVTGRVGSALGLASVGAGTNLGARLMTNPKWVKWLAKSTEIPTAALPAQINVLKRIAKENDEPDIAEAAAILQQDLEQGQQE